MVLCLDHYEEDDESGSGKPKITILGAPSLMLYCRETRATSEDKPEIAARFKK